MSYRKPASSAYWAVAALAALPFLPALRNGWVNWDDLDAIARNPMIRGFSPENVRWMLTTFHLGHYQPLAWLTLALDLRLWGGSPAGVHATAIALHAGAAALYFALARELLLRARPGDAPRARDAAAALAALGFAVHPLRVESVAWATERRDVLCGLFMLATLLSYLRGRTRAALGFYGLALASKVFAAALPAVLLALDYYPLRRLSRRTLLEKWPYALMAAAALGLGLAAQASTPALRGLADYGLAARLAQAAYSVPFYLSKTAFPVGLSAWYGDSHYAPPLEAAAGLALAVCVTFLCRGRPAALAAWAAYLALLSPAAGLVKSGAQLVADRYSYFACLPLPVLLAGAALSLGPRARRAAAACACAGLAGLAALTWRQTGFWRDSEALWTRACAMNPESPFPRTSLILAYLDLDRPDLALLELGRLKNAPTDDGSSYEGLAARVLNNAGVQLAQQGRLEQAEAALARAVELQPGLAEARRNLSAARAALAAQRKRTRR